MQQIPILEIGGSNPFGRAKRRIGGSLSAFARKKSEGIWRWALRKQFSELFSANGDDETFTKTHAPTDEKDIYKDEHTSGGAGSACSHFIVLLFFN